jgi:hydroxyacylglutathione hydrolase
MNLIALPAFTDNYIWMIHDAAQAVVVDPGDAQVVIQALRENSLQLSIILLTHHHADHTGGVDELRALTGCQVIGPAFEKMPEHTERVSGGEHIQALGHRFEVMDVPGHTAGHIVRISKVSRFCFVATRFFLAAAGGFLKARLRKCSLH